jgi:hypothetical protein
MTPGYGRRVWMGSRDPDVRGIPHMSTAPGQLGGSYQGHERGSPHRSRFPYGGRVGGRSRGSRAGRPSQGHDPRIDGTQG